MVDANVIIDKHCPSPVLVRVCEEGKVEFVEVLLKYGANVHVSKTLTYSIDCVPKWAWLQVAVTSQAVVSYSDDIM